MPPWYFVSTTEQRDGVDLIDHLDAVADRMLPGLAGRPLTVLRVLRGRAPFMQKDVPKYTPDWVRTVSMWAEASKRDVHHALCEDRRTLLWLANQRAVEYHQTLGLAENIYRPTHLILDLYPPGIDDFAAVVAVAHLVRRALADTGLAGAVKTSGARGIHVFVPIVAAAYSSRLRPSAPVSFPLDWSGLDRVVPADFTVHTALDALGGRDPRADSMPARHRLPSDLIEQGRAIPAPSVSRRRSTAAC